MAYNFVLSFNLVRAGIFFRNIATSSALALNPEKSIRQKCRPSWNDKGFQRWLLASSWHSIQEVQKSEGKSFIARLKPSRYIYISPSLNLWPSNLRVRQFEYVFFQQKFKALFTERIRCFFYKDETSQCGCKRNCKWREHTCKFSFIFPLTNCSLVVEFFLKIDFCF